MENRAIHVKSSKVGPVRFFGPRWSGSGALAMVAFLAALTVTVVAPMPAVAESVTATIPAGANPRAVAVNPLTNRIYVANRGSDNVTVIDGATNGTTTGSQSNEDSICGEPTKLEVCRKKCSALEGCQGQEIPGWDQALVVPLSSCALPTLVRRADMPDSPDKKKGPRFMPGAFPDLPAKRPSTASGSALPGSSRQPW